MAIHPTALGAEGGLTCHSTITPISPASVKPQVGQRPPAAQRARRPAGSSAPRSSGELRSLQTPLRETLRPAGWSINEARFCDSHGSPPLRERDRPSRNSPGTLHPATAAVHELKGQLSSTGARDALERLRQATHPTQSVQVGLANSLANAVAGSWSRDRPDVVPDLSCWFAVEPPAGIEPATPSLPFVWSGSYRSLGAGRSDLSNRE
jgi:hypothetical protein